MTGGPLESRAPAQRGLTIIELMIAIVILGIVVAAAFSVSYSIMNSYREHRHAMSVERSVRGAMAVLTDAVRNASPGVPDGEIVDLVGCETAWQGIRVDNLSDGPDAIDLIYASGGAVTTLRAPFTDASTQMLVENGSLFRQGDQVLVTDFDKGHLLTITGTVVSAPPDWVVNLTAAPQTACTPGPAAFTYPVRSAVIRVQKARFWVDTTSTPVLRMDRDGPGGSDGDAVAEGIEDLQIAIGVDRDGDGGLSENGAAGDDDDWVFNHPDDTQLPAMTVSPYRAIRLTVTARTVDETTNVPTSRRPGAEDRTGATAPDLFRRRSLSTTVELRNLQGSP